VKGGRYDCLFAADYFPLRAFVQTALMHPGRPAALSGIVETFEAMAISGLARIGFFMHAHSFLAGYKFLALNFLGMSMVAWHTCRPSCVAADGSGDQRRTAGAAEAHTALSQRTALAPTTVYWLAASTSREIPELGHISPQHSMSTT